MQAGDAETDAQYQQVLREYFEDKKAEALYFENLEPDFTRNFRDEVYMNGEVKRTDYSCDRPEALTEINRLVEAFPEYTVEQLTAEAQNVIGQYGAYRLPYNDNSISFYDFTTPSTETPPMVAPQKPMALTFVLARHQARSNKLTKTAKFVFSQSHGLIYPIRHLHYQIAPSSLRVFTMLTEVSSRVDVYIISTINYMREWCDERSLTFPLPDDVTEQPWCFSVVYNDDTGEMSSVKAYKASL